MKTTLLICGAGPTGLSLAAQAVRYKIPHIIIEKNNGITNLSKALAVHARSLEIFDQIGLAKKAIGAGQIAEGVRMLVNGSVHGSFNLSKVGKGMSKFPFALILEQNKLEKILYNHLKQKKSNVQWNTKLVNFRQTKKGVTAILQRKNGTRTEVQADYLVGCDGASSFVRKKLKLNFEGDTIDRTFYVADVQIDWNLTYNKHLYVSFSRDTFVAFFPMKGKKRFRAVGVLPNNPKSDTIPFDEIEKIIKRDSNVPLKITDTSWHSIYRVHSRMAETFQKGRVFVAGDAAHIHTPAGGQGMNTGIQDAYNLAWKLARNNESDIDLFKTYNTERVENARNLLRTTDSLFNMLAGGSWLTGTIRLHVFPKIARFLFNAAWFNKRIFPKLSQTGIAYPESDLTMPSSIGNVSAGDRMPYFKIGKASIYDKLTKPTFTLLSMGKITPAKKLNVAFDPEWIHHIHCKNIPRKIFGNAKGFYILLRPDNHIIYIGNDVTQITRCLQSV